MLGVFYQSIHQTTGGDKKYGYVIIILNMEDFFETPHLVGGPLPAGAFWR